MFQNTDLNNLSNKCKGAFEQASTIMMEARDFAASVGLQGDEPAWAQICGNLDTRLVMHVHGKTAPTRKKFSNLNEIAVTFYDELLAAFPEQVKAVACPWVAVPLATPEAKS